MSGQPTQQFSDERLVAYVDGEASAEERGEIECALPHAPELQARVAAFRATGRDLSKLFDGVLQAPIPQRVLDTIMNAPIGGRATVVPFARTKRTETLPRAMALAAAACVAFLAVGYGARQILVPQKAGTEAPVALARAMDGTLIAGPELASVLDTKTSNAGLPTSLAGREATLRPLLSFASAEGGYCRKYAVTLAAGENFAGIACRLSGTWRIAAHEAVARGPAAADQIVVAGDAGHESVDTVIERMRTGDVLSAEEETTLIGRQWRAIAH